MKAFRVPLLLVSAGCAAVVVALTWLIVSHPFIPLDAAIERDVQAVNFGPLTPVFAFYTAIGGPLGVVGEAVIVALVLLLNRPAWRLLLLAAFASGWYFLVANLVIRARPAVPDVLRVTEHPGASSYPSGHVILFTFYAVVLMLAIGYRYLPRSWTPYGWAVAAVLVAIGAVSRIYSGAHWPTDVLAGLLIAVAWLSLVVAFRWASDPVFARRRPAGPLATPARTLPST